MTYSISLVGIETLKIEDLMKETEEKETMYIFTKYMVGRGTSEGEAWTDAVDSFCQDAGEPDIVRQDLEFEE